MDKFRATIAPLLPGYLVLFDLADTKRRNLHVGHERVDQDIAYFARLLNQCVGTAGPTKRIGGDKWLAFAADCALTYRALLHNYPQLEPVTTGIACQAKSPRGAHLFVKKEIETTIWRAFRCLCARLEDQADFVQTLELLKCGVWTCPVNEVTVYEATLKNQSQATRWRCIAKDMLFDHACPFCQGRKFAWSDGATDCATGLCEKCGALCDFTFY